MVSNFVAQALRKEPITIYGDGSQTRSFQFVDDLVAGLMRLMDNEEHTGQGLKLVHFRAQLEQLQDTFMS